MFKTNQNAHNLRSALLLGAASAAALGMSAPAIAQQTSGSVETVVVTGSRIPQTGIYAASPVTAVGQQEIKLEGTVNTYQLINNLPEAFADQNDTVTNAGTGTANVDLRGLGSKRTLVLVNGTRLAPGDPAVPVADLNQVPAALVDHVEVLTGGASAVYGSDALAGVVNFIMRKDFEGIEVDGQYSVNQSDNNNPYAIAMQQRASFPQAGQNVWDGSTQEATLIMGTNTANDKGNVTGYIGYQNTEAVYASARDYSACGTAWLGPKSPLGTVGNENQLECFGSSNYQRFISLDADTNNGDFFNEGDGGKVGTGTFVPFQDTNAAMHFNFGPLQILQRPDTRYTGGFFAHYQENKELDLYSSFMFMDDKTVEQLAPSGLFLGSGVISGAADLVNCTNPLLTAQERSKICPGPGGGPNSNCPDGGCNNTFPGQSLMYIGRRDVEGGNRITTLDHTSYRMQIGARGDLGDGWSYDIYAQYSTTLFQEIFSGNFSKSRVQNALEVDPATGKCYSAEPNSIGIETDPNCVPLNIFNGIGGITPAALNYVSDTSFQQGYTNEQVVSGSLTGDLGEWGIQSPWAKNPVGVSIGTEYRQEQLELNVSRDFYSNDIDGSGGATLPVPLSGFNVTEGFTELRVPLVQGMPWVEDLTLNGGYRYSSYSTAGAVSAYKDGLEWQPIDDFRLRASFERAVRAPNVLELFAPQNKVLFAGNDPCASSTAGQCANVPNAGTALLTCPASQCDTLSGGNTLLKPEVAHTQTIGGVFTPTFLDGFTLTVDYFDIKVNGFISAINSNTVLGECYGPAATAASIAIFCPLVHRNSFGAIFGSGYVSGLTQNTGFLSTDGMDFEANYQADLSDWGFGPYGSLNFNFVGTLLDSLVTQPLPIASLGKYDCAGLYGVVCGSPNPNWRHKLRVTWTSPWDVDLSLSWRHFSSVLLDANTSNPLLQPCAGPCNDVPDAEIHDYDYFDVAVDWQVREGVDLRAGVNNIFDRDPPILDTNAIGASSLAGFGNGNTYPGVYDPLGRFIFFGATIKY